MKDKSKHLDSDDSLAIRAAWLHYVGGLTQAAVAKRLGLTSVKTHRLISKAVAEGAVKVSIDGAITDCVALEDELIAKFGLSHCIVAPDLGEEGIPFKTLGQAGSTYLRNILTTQTDITIGLALGRALAAVVNQLPRIETPSVRFVSLLGGLTRDYSINRDDVLHWIAAKTGAPSYTMPVPLLANSVEDREVLLAQKGVKEVFSMANNADIKIIGIGTVAQTAQLVASGPIKPEEIVEIARAGAVGEAMGHFFDEQGKVIQTSLSARMLSVSLEGKQGEVTAIAGGEEKVEAIRAVLNGNLLTGLITDEITAKAILQ
ncbi:sugar-binding transcriptional regulator [Maribrevibacterium harenarium]|uniref:Sugar-binding transcriptional regulator n=1 Tax=Maribrevibacterium harenarium TaxID=2589817 RepID=A0A501X3A1_9GAMM|nr:sugar-binding transcriptional regulator [Maribrevibacterium harenarium]TPE54971.1 sugar-binding transcriptional regulator [Maribrevibacterium harenarium]